MNYFKRLSALKSMKCTTSKEIFIRLKKMILTEDVMLVKFQYLHNLPSGAAFLVVLIFVFNALTNPFLNTSRKAKSKDVLL